MCGKETESLSVKHGDIHTNHEALNVWRHDGKTSKRTT